MTSNQCNQYTQQAVSDLRFAATAVAGRYGAEIDAQSRVR